MSHEIEIRDNGKARAIFANTPAWHTLGEVFKGEIDLLTAVNKICPEGLLELGLEAYIIDSEGNKISTPFPSHKAIIRADGKHIGCVGKDYQIDQPFELAGFAQPFLDSKLCTIEAGGLLRDGKRMFFLLKVKDGVFDVVKGDAVETYLLLATSFDGSMVKVIKLTGTRVVCANTLAIALRDNQHQDLSFRIRHTKNMGKRTDDAQQIILKALSDMQTSVEAYKVLAHKQVSRMQAVTYVRNVIAPEVVEKDYSPQMKTKVNLVIDLIDTQRGIELVPAIKGTAWQAYNAVTEYYTHHASRTADARVNNQWFDNNTITTNKNALEMALAL